MSKKIILVLITVICFSSINAQNAKKFYSSAIKFLESLSYQDAITNFSKAIELDPKHVKAYKGRAFCYEKTGNIIGAIEDYKRAIVFEPKDKELYYNAGRLSYDIGKYDAAYELLHEAVNKDQQYYAAIEIMLKALLKKKEYKLGMEAASLWLEGKKSSAAFYYHAVLFDSLQNYVEAEKEYKNSKYYDSKFMPAYVGLIFVQNKLKKYDEAMTIADAAIAKDPSYKDIYYARSFIFASKNDYGSAVNDISKVIGTDQNNEALFIKRAEYYEKLAQYQNAIYDYSKVIGMNSKNLDAYYKRAWNYEQLTNYKLASADYEKIMAMAPNNDKAKEMMKNVMAKLFELNRETFKPDVELLTPKANEKNVVKLALDKTTLTVRGTIKDASKIKAVMVNTSTAKYNTDTLNPDFESSVEIGAANEFSVSATDVYDNTRKIIYTVERTEINKPLIAITTPLESSGLEIMLDNLNPELFIEGKVTDESLIESIIIEGVSASYPLESLNPVFSTKLKISDKSELNIRVRDIYGNETNAKYKLSRESAAAGLDNPMGLTWVVFIENSTYKNFPMLDGPAKDVSMMKSALANYKVSKTIHKKDLGKTEMETFFNIELRDQLRNNKVRSLVVWYSGHGKYVNQTGYWIPVDAKRDDEASYFNLNTLQGALQNSYKTLDHELVITDACESGTTFLDAMRGDSAVTCNNPMYYKNKTAQVLTSAGFELASDNSEFAKNIARQLNDSKGCGASVDGIFFNLLDVARNSKGKMQTPKFGQIVGAGHVRPSTFFFIKK
jgi:tetratricopeptide (TPR) repeat protein